MPISVQFRSLTTVMTLILCAVAYSLPAQSQTIDCEAPVRINHEVLNFNFGDPKVRARCAVHQALVEGNHPDLVASIQTLRHDGFERPWGTTLADNISTLETSIRFETNQTIYTYIVAKLYSKVDPQTGSSGDMRSIYFQVEVADPRNQRHRAQVRITRITPSL